MSLAKKLHKVFIGKDISRTGTLTGFPASASNNLADGEILVLDKNKEILAAGSTIADTDTIYICEGLGSTYDYALENGTAVTGVRQILFSDPIEGHNVKVYKGSSYSAPVQQVITATLTGLTPVIGAQYGVRVQYRDLPEHPGMFSYTYRVEATTATLGDLIDLLVTKINTHADARVTASNSGDTALVLTAKAINDDPAVDSIDEYRQVNFEAFLVTDNFGSAATVVTTTDPFPGTGYWKIVRDEEKWAEGYLLGINNRTHFPVIAPTKRVVKDETYDVITIVSDKDYLSPDMSYSKKTEVVTKVYIPNPAAANQATDILAVLNPWMASLPKAFSNVTV